MFRVCSVFGENANLAVPVAGLEPARPYNWTEVFKTPVSTIPPNWVS